MITEIRNLTRLIWVTLPETTQAEHLHKINHIKMLLGFAYATRHALLEEPGVFHDFDKLIPDDLKGGPDYDHMPLPYQITYRVYISQNVAYS
jgi:predicted membrane chloride channel (bestrophin family)